MDKLSTIIIIVIGIFWVSCQTNIPEEIQLTSTDLPDQVDFNYHIKPILSDRCYKCHGPDANQRQAGFRIDLAEGAFSKTNGEDSQATYNLSAGNLSKSEVFHRLISEEAEYMMPPPEANLALTPREKALLIRWIEQGANYKPHWS
ncbi:MAG: c-type cytochrome domain-containing protein, partial [Saprospiraceae bacterium]